jgi:hypothetical protein
VANECRNVWHDAQACTASSETFLRPSVATSPMLPNV